MIDKIFNTFLLLTLLAALVDCKIPQTPDLTFSAENETIEVPVGSIFKIELASNIGTGYSWTLKAPLDSNFVAFVDQEYLENDLMTEEEESKEIWRFKGLKKGQAQIEMIYKRPWEKVSEEAIEQTFTIKFR
ncbi:MAG: protease inhibitor I42 family protein [Bacteroidota bacterium]